MEMGVTKETEVMFFEAFMQTHDKPNIKLPNLNSYKGYKVKDSSFHIILVQISHFLSNQKKKKITLLRVR